MTAANQGGTVTASGRGRKALWLGLLVAWSALIMVGIALMYTGLDKTGYFEPTRDAILADRVGKLQIYAASVALLVAAGWARMMLTPVWACILVASPAVLVGGLTLVFENSWFPHIAALVTFPLAVAGLIGGLVLARPLRRLGAAH
jgi:hypothetical protein